MKIKTIKMIEDPIKEVRLDSQSMDALLGGDFCVDRSGNYCGEYMNGTSCNAPGVTRCTRFTW